MQEILDRIYDKLADSENKLFQGYYLWLEEFVKEIQPKVVVELGTFEGGSAVHILNGLPPDSIFVTVDKTKNHSKLQEVSDDRFKTIIGDDLSDTVFNQIPDGIDILFVDSDHNFTQVTRELDLYSKKFSDTCYVVLDDIHLPAMQGFWSEITRTKYDLSEWHGSGFGLVIWEKENE